MALTYWEGNARESPWWIMLVGMKEHTDKTRAAKCCGLSRSFPPQKPNLGVLAQKNVPQSTQYPYTPEQPHGVKGLWMPFKVNTVWSIASTCGCGCSCSNASGAGLGGCWRRRGMVLALGRMWSLLALLAPGTTAGCRCSAGLDMPKLTCLSLCSDAVYCRLYYCHDIKLFCTVNSP